ncbi:MULTISPECIES: MFS transporter [unclassified Pseudomonas]|uniref:MFS transporter n=1 Tax=unclassified Pseudomonas TaxID=196821 RepID=UPI0035C2520A
MSVHGQLLLRHHTPFIRFWLARVFTASGFQMLTVAIGWQMYSLTGNVLDLGLVGLVEFLPKILFILLTGHVADRFDRRKVAALCQCGQAMVAITLLVGSSTGSLTREMIFVIAFMMGTARAFEMPTTQALLPNIVPPGLFPAAVAASSSAMQTATIVSPALGGVLYAVAPAWVYGPALVLYLIAIYMMLSLPSQQKPLKQKISVESLLAGFRFIRSRPEVFGAISMDMFAVLLGGATALLPVFAKDILLTGPWGLGLLRSAPAVGALLMSIYLARHPIERRVGPVILGSVAIFGVATIGFGLSTSLWFSLATLVLLGAADMVSMVIRGAFVQLQTPDDMRGRVGAVNSLFIGASNQLGDFRAGVSAAWFGTVPAVLIGGFGAIGISLLWIKLFPALSSRDRIRDPLVGDEQAS